MALRQSEGGAGSRLPVSRVVTAEDPAGGGHCPARGAPGMSRGPGAPGAGPAADHPLLRGCLRTIDLPAWGRAPPSLGGIAVVSFPVF